MNLLARELAKKLADREATIQRVREWESANRFYLGDTIDRTWGFNQARREVRAILDVRGKRQCRTCGRERARRRYAASLDGDSDE